MDEARALGDASIGTKHLLLGLMRDEDGIAARALADLGVHAPPARPARPPRATASGQMPFDVAAATALKQSVLEADALGHHFVGTEHVLLGLCTTDRSGTEHVLGLAPERIRDEVLRLLSGDPE